MSLRTMLLISLLAGAVRAADPAPLTLGKAYELTLARSEALPIGEAEWRAAEARYRRAIGGRWPDVHAQAGASAREGISSTEHDIRLGVGATWTLFDGFRSTRDAEARRAEGEAIRFDTARTRQLLYEDVADAYFETLAREGEEVALNAQLAALTELTAELERRLTLGRSRRAELLAAQAQVAEIRISIEQSRSLRDAARELLAFLTGRPSDELALAEPGPLPPANEVAAVLAASEDRPDLLAAERRVKAAALDVAVARADQGAKVDLDGNLYVWRDPDDLDHWDLALRAQLPLFDRGVRKAAVAEKQEGVRVQELRLAQLRRVADRDVRLALRETLGGLAQWTALRAAAAITEESWVQQQKDYALGRANNLDVMAALAQLHGLHRREAVLSMQVRAALVRLQVAAGNGAP